MSRRKKRKKGNIKLANKKNRSINEFTPWKRPRMQMYQHDNPFPSDLTREERIEILKIIGDKYKGIFDEQYLHIEDWFKEYDALYILSFCSFHFMSQPEGIDLEALGKLDFYHHYLELLQAFSLRRLRTISPEPLNSKAEQLLESIKVIGEAMGFILLKLPEDCDSSEKIHAHRLRMEMMINTAAVRNWAYNHQMEQITLEVADLVKTDFEINYQLNPRLLLSTLFKAADLINNRLNNHFNNVRQIVKLNNYKKKITLYYKLFLNNSTCDDNEIDKLWNISKKNIKILNILIMTHTDLFLSKIYTLNINDIVDLYGDCSKAKELSEIMDKLSYSFGDLKDYDPEHFILNNPIHLRPFIKINNNSYFSAAYGIIRHLSIGILENLISIDMNLKEIYEHTLKPKYLEEKVTSIFRSNFPSGKIFQNVKWHNDADGRDYETDLVVLIDNFLLVIEAKSGSIPSRAQRGDPVSLFKTLQRLIEEPSDQAHRFINYLKENRNVHELSCAGGTCVLNSESINYFIPLGVTFSQVGMISSNLKKLIEANVTSKPIKELAPSISYSDLESIFELLALEAEKVHYLERRREFEDHVVYEGDELDLLSFYLDNGFNIGETEYSNSHTFILTPKSKELDPYFVGINEGVNVQKPSLEKTEWWKDILIYLANRKATKWMETSYIMLNTSKKDQQDFILMFRRLCNNIKNGNLNNKHNWVSCLTGPQQRRFLIVGYPYAGITKEERNNVLGEILNSDEALESRGVAIIGLNLDSNDYPYSVVAGRLDTDLFDI